MSSGMSLHDSLLISKSKRRHFVRNAHIFPFAAKLAATIQLQRFVRGYLCRLQNESLFSYENDEAKYFHPSSRIDIHPSTNAKTKARTDDFPIQVQSALVQRQQMKNDQFTKQSSVDQHRSPLTSNYPSPRGNILQSSEELLINRLLKQWPKESVLDDSEETLTPMDVSWLSQRWKYSLHRETYQHLIYYQKFSIFSDACIVIQRQYRLHKQYLIKTYGKRCFLDKRKRVRFYDSAHDSAAMIQRAWKRFLNRQIFFFYRDLIRFREMGDPKEMLRSVNPREAQLLDKASGVHVRFRLGGSEFPPAVYYKIFLHSPLVDINAFAPRDYTKFKPIPPPDLVHNRSEKESNRDVNAREGWYTRFENNGWRSISGSISTILEQEDEVAGSQNIMAKRLKEERSLKKKEQMQFHYSKLQRKQDIEKRKKQRKIEWMRKMYQMSSKQLKDKRRTAVPMSTTPTQTRTGKLSTSSEVDTKDLFTDLDDPEVIEMLKWCETLNFESYEDEWKMLATSSGSDTYAMSTSEKLLLLEQNQSRPEFASQLQPSSIDQSMEPSHLSETEYIENLDDEEVNYSRPTPIVPTRNVQQKLLVDQILRGGATMDDYLRERESVMDAFENM